MEEEEEEEQEREKSTGERGRGGVNRIYPKRGEAGRASRARRKAGLGRARLFWLGRASEQSRAVTGKRLEPAVERKRERTGRRARFRWWIRRMESAPVWGAGSGNASVD